MDASVSCQKVALDLHRPRLYLASAEASGTRKSPSQALDGFGQVEEATKNILLSWMIKCADEFESDRRFLANLEIVISLATIQTLQMNVVHILYDLVVHPEYVKEIREEVREVALNGSGWQNTSYGKLRNLDSFFKKSQRFEFSSMLSYPRIMQATYVLSDVTTLPLGSYICIPVNAIQHDPDIKPNPEMFDGLRYHRSRQRLGEGYLHQFATSEKNLLNFEHGRYVGLGRFFASLEIKVILVRLIVNLTSHQGRPANLKAHEFLFPALTENCLSESSRDFGLGANRALSLLLFALQSGVDGE